MDKIKGKILWADDEIEMLKSHIIFLENKGYSVKSVSNGEDAVVLSRMEKFDLVLLDEMMPGKDGLQTLTEIKEYNPALPVIMITKSEEETLMEDAIGSKINDYLTKPVNPSQILLAIKKIFETKDIESAKISRDYSSEFVRISQSLNMGPDYEEWIEIYSKLSEWWVELDRFPDLGLEQSLKDQIKECNIEFSKYIEKSYLEWIHSDKRPVLSVDIISKYVIPELQNGKNVFFIIIDCLRLDQWLALESVLFDYFNIKKEFYYSILPSATPYSRNSIFSGLYPREIERHFPDLWKNGELDESSRNRFEKLFLDKHLARRGIKFKVEPKYFKILDKKEAEEIEKNINNYIKTPLTSLVFNFVDNLTHKRSESEILKQIVPDEAAFRSLTSSWFLHSNLLNILKKISKSKAVVYITTDHGSIRVSKPTNIKGDRETSTNLRYKVGRNLQAESKDALNIKKPEDYKLPVVGVHCNYVLAKDDNFLVYPTNYHKFVNMYKDSFQHGGISMEEMILPVVRLEGKG